VVLFGSIYLGVLLVGYILARIFIDPIVEQRKQLNNFIRDTTHELNTPVSAIVLSIADDIGDISAKSLLRIKYSAKRITEIYSDLTYLFLEGTPMNNTSFIPKSDTKDMLDSQMIYLSQMAENKEQNLICHFSNSIQKISREDFLRLANNLITNAIKYTPKNGTITIALNSEKLCVEDNGVGIRKEQQEKIFERFYRASNEVGGFGIGLSIVKNIVQKYSYGIQIDSEPNVGTTVSVYFN
jgi:two-component system OmpR family sensor kinase